VLWCQNIDKIIVKLIYDKIHGVGDILCL